MNPYVFTYLMFFLQGLLESYFLCHFLDSDQKKKSFMLSQIILCILQHPLQMLLFDIQGVKMIFYILSLYVVVFICFPKNNLKRKLFSVILLMLLISFVEVIAIFLEIITIGMPEMLSIQQPHPLHVYLLQLIVMYIVFTIVLRFIHKQMMLNKKDMFILGFLSLLQFAFLYLLNVNITMEIIHVTIETSYYIYFFLLTLSVIVYCFVIVYLIKRQKQKKDEMMLLLLQKEYEEQLTYYMQQKEIHTDISMIRHDLMNYVQSQMTEE